MIDLHCHILPFVDDGARNARMACEMAEHSLRTGVDIIVHVTRMRDKSRRVEEIREVLGMQEDTIHTHVLYAFEEEQEGENGVIIGALQKKGELVRNEKLKKAGIAPDT